MKTITKYISLSISALLLLSGGSAFAQQQATSLSDLLDLVEQDKVAESAEYTSREQEFQSAASRQEEVLTTTKNRVVEQENLQSQLSDQFEANEIIIADKREALRDRRGDLNELFGTLQGVAGDFMSTFSGSIISAQYPGRTEYLDEFIERAGSSTEQLAIEEIERFWFFMQQEMTESGNVVKYSGTVALPSGETTNRSITRIGSFNAISEGDYLSYNADIGHLQVLPRQPTGSLINRGEVVGRAIALENSSSGITKVAIDPTGGIGGQVLANLINFPTVDEQVANNSGPIGFIIIGVGIVGIFVALVRSLLLTIVAMKVGRQLKSDKPSKNNPLGRVLAVADANPNADTETLELKLGEAILQETPALERFLTLIKIIATVAPLMGLLGTVTGMIQVFQQITVYGAGDPTIMAGGISVALMTTVLGITVAIPMVLMHTWVKSKSDDIIHILEEQATGMIAAKAEQKVATQ
ncbi:MAG: MotA/TolQ/ExbB proton channel family protein [Gammaproteobacteria bacterium]|nr:MotA/TolQ/ExbB proton channel family protein [Gammaproteobacteria bacterium]